MNNQLVQKYQWIKESLEKYGLHVENYQTIQYGIQFKIVDKNGAFFLRIFQNKKNGIVIDYSQIRSEFKLEKIKNILESTHKSVETNDADFLINFPVIGTDESGKGDYFGPLVVAGVSLTESTEKMLNKIGVVDCKRLSDEMNIKLSEAIYKICDDHVSVVSISPEKYNELYEQYRMRNEKLNEMLSSVHVEIIKKCMSRINPSTIVVDQFANERLILSQLHNVVPPEARLIQTHEAERFIAVAAASVIARAKFLNELELLKDKYQFPFPKGASQEVIHTGIKFVKQFGKPLLSHVAKLHFKTTDFVLNAGGSD